MKNKYLILAMDGSGASSYNHESKDFCVSSLILDNKLSDKLDRKLFKLKKKYFGNVDVVLHYSEVSRKIGVFKTLKDRDEEDKFWGEIISLVNHKNIYLVFSLVNKREVRAKGWQEKTIVEKSYRAIITLFGYKLKKEKTKGKILTESDIYSDKALIQVHNENHSVGIPSKKISGKKYNEMITCLSLVNKYNLDSSVQIADLLGSAARLKFRLDNGSDEKTTKLQRKIIRLIDRKLSKKEAEFIIVK